MIHSAIFKLWYRI